MSKAISTSSISKSVIIEHLKKNRNRAYVIYTNRDVITPNDFLEPIESFGDPINVEGRIYKFKFEDDYLLDNNFKPELFEDLFLYTSQPHVANIDRELKKILTSQIRITNRSDKDLDEIITKFVFFIQQWSEGLLDGNYLLAGTKILGKIAEIVLEPFMVKFDDEMETQEKREDQKSNLWNEIVEDKDLIIINKSDQIVDEFIKEFIYKIVVEHKESLKHCKTVRKDLMRVREDFPITSCRESYEYLWKSRKIPLVIEADSKEKLEEIKCILKMSQETFKIILLNKSDFPAGSNLWSTNCKIMSTMSDLNKQQQSKLFELPIKLQGRYLPLWKLNLNQEKDYELNVKDIIYLLCDKVNIGEEFQTLPDIPVDLSLKRVWLKPAVLQEVTDDAFFIRCDFNGNFNDFIQRQNLNVNDFVNIEDFNSDSSRIILYKNQDDLKLIPSKRKSIHFLILRKSFKLEWVKSWGTIKNLQNFRKSEKCEKRK
ncbi:hypothetical protein ILUMI_22207 [Ignelater luminosus]|uniref:Uncharacterized protein n=1 Tax=Ignelater luminosus TaxID=2038154 RepID=A0A8K0G304_IGNLU|nr:hypothetical protein ILUMI_22207 [Ignelater luminosus]